MADRDPRTTDQERVEPFQPEPSLREGRIRPWVKWVAGTVVVFVVVFVLYALNAPGPEPQAGSSPQPATTSSAPAPSATTGSSPNSPNK